jgi:hypothetical protein
MSWKDGGFSFPSLRDRQNTLVIGTILHVMTSPDDIMRKPMKQSEMKRAEDLHIEWRERDRDSNQGFLN